MPPRAVRFLALLSFLVAVPAAADDAAPPVALVGGRVLTASGEAIADGVVLLSGGRIEAVGAAIEVPSGYRSIDCAGKVVTPGLIDADSSLGLASLDRSASRVTADARAVDAFDAWSPRVATARAEGVTTLLLTGNPSDTLGGTSAVVSIDGEALKADGPLVFNLATGSRSAGTWGAARLAAVRKTLVSARDRRTALERWSRDLAKYEAERRAEKPLPEEEILLPADLLREMQEWTPAERAAWREAAFKSMQREKKYTKPKKPASAPRRPRSDTGLDAVIAVLDPDRLARRPVLLRAELAIDVQAALGLVAEFRLEARIVGGEGLADHAEALAKRKARVIVGNGADDAHRSDGPLAQRRPGLVARLVDAGLKPALGSGGSGGGSRYLRLLAAKEIGEGLAPDDALRALTVWAARVAGVSRRAGSIEAGKRADVVVWSGDPFSPTTRTEHVFVGGRDVRD
jgi:imidazolonepropionase-like amidohydrolase